MKKRILCLYTLVFSVLAFSGCSGPVVQSTEGESIGDAIMIDADYSDEGIPMEYDWLSENGCPDDGGVTEVTMQELLQEGEHLYDALHVTCGNGTEKVYYFNIDRFFGNWR